MAHSSFRLQLFPAPLPQNLHCGNRKKPALQTEALVVIDLRPQQQRVIDLAVGFLYAIPSSFRRQPRELSNLFIALLQELFSEGLANLEH